MRPLEQLPFNPARWPFFYGWMILIWGVIGVLLSVPGQTTGVSAFIEPLLENLKISRLQLSGAYMFGTLSSGFLLTPAGKMFDRVGARWMGFGSCLILGIVLFLLSQTDHIAAILSIVLPEQMAVVGLLAVLFFLLRLSGQGILTMTARNMIMKWFDRHRGLASGLTGASVAFGFSYAPTLFNNMIDIRGWSGSWLLMGILLFALFAPLLLIFFRDNPEASGLVPDGKVLPAEERKKPEIQRQYTLAEARRTFSFWAFTLTMAVQALVITAVTFNIESIFETAGMDGARGFSLFPPAAILSIIVNLLGGWLSDRTRLSWFLAIMLLSMASYMIGLILLKPGFAMYVVIVCYGIANGLFGILSSVTWPRYFGRDHLGAISGLCMTMMVMFSAIGPAFFNLMLNITGNYSGSLLVCLTGTAGLFICSFYVRNPQQSKV